MRQARTVEDLRDGLDRSALSPSTLAVHHRGQALGIEPDELLGIDIAATELLAVEATEPRCGGIEPRGVGAKYGRTGVL